MKISRSGYLSAAPAYCFQQLNVSIKEDLLAISGDLLAFCHGLAKLEKLPPRIFITYLRPQYYDKVIAELEALLIPGIELLREGIVYEI